MKFKSYKVLTNQSFSLGEYSIIPIRDVDRYDIMKWRNEQMYHLRQIQPLTPEIQDHYFSKVVSNLFSQEKPEQLLFSYLSEEKCIGYGGLVHINWVDRNAEISFIMDTALESESFEFHWKTYLTLIEEVAFQEIGLHKIFTYAFDLRPQLYTVLERCGYSNDAILRDHCFIDGVIKDVKIHSKINMLARKVTLDDAKITFKWANDKRVRRYSFNTNKIEWDTHIEWFESKINSHLCYYYIIESADRVLGSVRFDIEDNCGLFSYLLDPVYHGRGWGIQLLKEAINQFQLDASQVECIEGWVLNNNYASVRIFEKLGFNNVEEKDDNTKFQLKLP